MNIQMSAAFGICAAFLSLGVPSAMAGGKPSEPEAIGGVHGKCAPNKKGYRTSTDTQVTDSGINIRLPSTKVVFNQNANKPKCVIVTFSGQPKADNGRQIHIEARIDGEKCSPSQTQFASNTTEPYYRSHSYTFICPGIEPGKHRADIYWRRGSAAGYVYIGNHTMLVEYY